MPAVLEACRLEAWIPAGWRYWKEHEQFIRQALEQGIRSFDEKIRRSRLEVSHPGFQPLYPKVGWRKDLRSKGRP